jgi:hypothetical protein
MNTRTSRFAPRVSGARLFPRPTESLFAQRFAAASGRNRFSASPRYRLIDPLLLDRLQSPLTRYHD